ncbi:hypothetical protein MJO29_000367, partial [Puccinia striiformis f. sp. tritici]
WHLEQPSLYKSPHLTSSWPPHRPDLSHAAIFPRQKTSPQETCHHTLNRSPLSTKLVCPASMSPINLCSLNDFSMYLMPKKAAPVCPPCQSETLSSVFEDDDEDDCELENKVNVLSKVKVVKNMIVHIKLPPCLKTSSPKFFSSNRLRSLTLSPKSSLSTTDMPFL